MQRRWVWSIAGAVVLLVIGIVGVQRDSGGVNTVRTRDVGAQSAQPSESTTPSTVNEDAAVTSSTTVRADVSAQTTTSVARSRTVLSPSASVAPSASGPDPTTATTAPRRWVTVAALSHDVADPARVDSTRFDLTTGKARFVLDSFEVGDETGGLYWYVVGSDPYHAEAHGQCEGPVSSTPRPGSSPTTANPSPTGPNCDASYQVAFDIAPGSYTLRVDSTHARWTARLQEFR
jgi:hypothetical protein